MQLEIYLVLMVIAFASIALGYAIDTKFFSTFGFAILFFLGTILMGLNSDDGILVKSGDVVDSSFVYDNGTLVSESSSTSFSYDSFTHFFFGLLMSFISIISIMIILLDVRSRGLND